MNEPATPEVRKAIDSVFDDPPEESLTPQSVSTPLGNPEPEPEPQPAPPEPPKPKPVEEDIIPEEVLAPSELKAKPDDLLPLPDQSDDTVPASARPVIERYAFESREQKRLRVAAEEELSRVKAERQNTPADTGEAEALKTRVQELENEIGRIDLSRSPAFREQYEGPLQQVENTAFTVLTRAGVDEADARSVLAQVWGTQNLREREVAFDSLDTDVSPAVVGSIIQMSVQYDQARETRDKALEEWKTSRAAVEERATREKQAKDTRSVQDITTKAFERVREENNPFYRTTEGNQQWNDVVAHYQDASVGVLKRNDPVEIASLVAHGLTHARLLSMYSQERSRRLALESESMGESPASPASGRPTNPAPRSGGSAPQTTAGVLNQLFPT